MTSPKDGQIQTISVLKGGMTLREIVDQTIAAMKAQDQMGKRVTVVRLEGSKELQHCRVHLSNGNYIDFDWRLPGEPGFGKEN